MSTREFQETVEKNTSERTHEITEKDLLTEKEVKELLDWYNGKILRSDDY